MSSRTLQPKKSVLANEEGSIYGSRDDASASARPRTAVWHRGHLDVSHATRYYRSVAIRTFKCADTAALFRLQRVARFSNIERPALRKLKQLDLARRIEDMRAPPANRLELLKGNRAGQWSVRVNDQFRICFRWQDAGAEGVEIVDYH